MVMNLMEIFSYGKPIQSEIGFDAGPSGCDSQDVIGGKIFENGIVYQ